MASKPNLVLFRGREQIVLIVGSRIAAARGKPRGVRPQPGMVRSTSKSDAAAHSEKIGVAIDVADDMGLRLQDNLSALDRSLDDAVHDYSFCRNHSANESDRQWTLPCTRPSLSRRWKSHRQ